MRYSIGIPLFLTLIVGSVAIAPRAHAESFIEIVTKTASGNLVGDVPFEMYYDETGELYFKQQTDGITASFTLFIGRPASFTIVAHWKNGQTTKEQVKVGPGLNTVVLVEPAAVTIPPPTIQVTAQVASEFTDAMKAELCAYAKTLTPGARGEKVSAYQRLLRAAGFTIDVTGYYGDQTRALTVKALVTICGEKNVKPVTNLVNEGDRPEAPPPAPSSVSPAPVQGAHVKEAARRLQSFIVQFRKLLAELEKIHSLLNQQ